MIQGFLLAKLGIDVVEEFVVRAAFTRPGKTYKRTVVNSEVVLTPQELEDWVDDTMDIEERVAVYRRGLLRKKFAG